MSKKNTIAIIVILAVIVILGLIGYNILSNNLWTENGKVEDGHADTIEHLNNLENPQEKEKQVNFFLNANVITQKEADEILGR